MSALQINRQEEQCLRSKMKTDHKRQDLHTHTSILYKVCFYCNRSLGSIAGRREVKLLFKHSAFAFEMKEVASINYNSKYNRRFTDML